MTVDWLTSAPIAHRGLHDLKAGVPENSLAAIEASCLAGLPIELDVRILGDRTVVVFHDKDLKRVANDLRRLSNLGKADISKISLLGTAERIPTLAQTLDLVAGRVPLLIEIKNDHHHAGALEQQLYQQVKNYRGEFAVISFNPISLSWFARRYPNILRGQTSSHLPVLRLDYLAPVHAGLKHLAFNSLSQPHFIIYNHRGLTMRAPRRARRLGMQVLAYTIRSEAERVEALKYCDNIIFEGFPLAKMPS
ncbi:MAG: glycerophosphodiester phosphodiesterase [Alphaproteobacteria bacterium]|jgi:glycerophosphoryl diester phosphodiesterase|nr:glycerophosphodiester phosphodiesterase [Alphaproteobacteria bacterium]MBT4965768.1 glycerophosphodiester phosphodiesterase [Alphaproteobacteria bacterium]MBT5917623.1 glycerophosphodiester phosphodiesterase [Alphaproteobacteria bacterium]MBT7747404.1 glycerophosphodiester phosphodiesterase [Alphaproteobacteria bacterium]